MGVDFALAGIVMVAGAVALGQINSGIPNAAAKAAADAAGQAAKAAADAAGNLPVPGGQLSSSGVNESGIVDNGMSIYMVDPTQYSFNDAVATVQQFALDIEGRGNVDFGDVPLAVQCVWKNGGEWDYVDHICNTGNDQLSNLGMTGGYAA